MSTHLARILMTLLYKISKKLHFKRVAEASKHCMTVFRIPSCSDFYFICYFVTLIVLV